MVQPKAVPSVCFLWYLESKNMKCQGLNIVFSEAESHCLIYIVNMKIKWYVHYWSLFASMSSHARQPGFPMS
jgi:hypothetical protein